MGCRTARMPRNGGKNENISVKDSYQEHGTETKTARMLRLYCKLG